MIKLHNIQKVYRTSTIETVALEQVNLEIAMGEFVSVMGRSGRGKSTLLNIAGLLVDATEGSVVIAGEDGNALSDKRKAAFRNKHIGFVFQNFHLINELNVLDNVELPMLYAKRITPSEHRTRAMKVLERVGLSHRMKHFP